LVRCATYRDTTVEDLLIRDTALALDQALARVALRIGGTAQRAQDLLKAAERGERSQPVLDFLSEAAALMRARLLLADALKPVAFTRPLRRHAA
jgi:hypothetical protein